MLAGVIMLTLVNLCRGRGPHVQLPLTFVQQPMQMRRRPVAAPTAQMNALKQRFSKISHPSLCSKSSHPRSRLHAQSVQEQFRSHGSSSGDETVIARTCCRDQPMDWEELHETIIVKKDLTSLFRSQQVEDRYTQHRLEILQTYDSIYDYILHSKFNLPRQWNPQTSRWQVPYNTNSTSTLIALAPNDFPYYTSPGIDHWVLWKLGRSITEDDMVQALKTLRDDHGVSATIHWENPPHLKSLPGIDHYHILAKTRDA